MHDRRSFGPAVLALTVLSLSAPVHAGPVLLNNLDQSVQGSSSGLFVGQSFIAGDMNEPLYGAQMQLDPVTPPGPGIELELESRNFNGTVGTTLYSNFTSTFDATTGLVTFNANVPFNFTAGTGYWLVLSDPITDGVTWDFTSSNLYQSQFGFGLASYDTSWISTADNGQGSSTYYQPSDGPQLFDLIAPSAASVPEPPSLLLLCFAGAIAVFARYLPGARASRLQRPRGEQARGVICSCVR